MVPDPSELPFGGWVDLYIVDPVYVGSAHFATVEYPEGSEASFLETPLPAAPPKEPSWEFHAAPGEEPEPAELPVYTDYDIGPQLFIEDSTVSLELKKLDGSVGRYEAPLFLGTDPYMTDAWSVEFVGAEDTPAELLQQVLPMAQPEFAFVMDGDIISGVTWTPDDGSEYAVVTVWC